jgi:rubredoxin
MNYQCKVCDYIYEEKKGDTSNIPFKDLPDKWKCPECGAHKHCFIPIAYDDKE